MRTRLALLVGVLNLAACGSTPTTASSGSTGSSTGTGSEGSSSSGSTGVGSTGGSGTSGASGGSSGSGGCASFGTQQARVACAANTFLDTLSPSQVSAAKLDMSDYADRTRWSNLPVGLVQRPGLQMGSLSAESQAAVLEMMSVALNDVGYASLSGVLRADDYLGSMQGGYGSQLYSVAIYGSPSATGDFEVMFGAHHMAYNLAFVDGGFFPIPHHMGAEPKAAFTWDGGTYAPMQPKGDALFAVFESLSPAQLSSAYLAGQMFSDVLIGPVEYGSGSTAAVKAKYPTGTNRTGVLVSALSSAQQALVVAAIEQWVREYPAEVADGLMADYTSSSALADTYAAWGGASSGPGKDASGSYLRLDGPRLWIELAVQNGVVIRNTTHYHSIYRDKQFDYAGEF